MTERGREQEGGREGGRQRQRQREIEGEGGTKSESKKDEPSDEELQPEPKLCDVHDDALITPAALTRVGSLSRVVAIYKLNDTVIKRVH
jgi:hypothetical protein